MSRNFKSNITCLAFHLLLEGLYRDTEKVTDLVPFFK